MRRLLILTAAILTLTGCFTVTSIDGQAGGHYGPGGISSGTGSGTVNDDAEGATTGPEADAIVTGPSGEEQPGSLSEEQNMIVQAAREILQTQNTTVGSTTYPYDCSGTILTVFARAGIYLVDLFPKYSGNGVARLYGIASDYEVFHARKLPVPGDVIFWDNTYDRDEDGKWNDPLTHAGIVISVEADGTVEYLHHNYRLGIVTASMNLLEPETYENDDGKMVNSPMRMASQRASNPDLWLSSHLFREFASMYLIHIDAASAEGVAVVASHQ